MIHANEEEDDPDDSRDRDNRDDNQDEEDDRRETSDSGDDAAYEKSDDDTQVLREGNVMRRGSAKSYEDSNQLNVSVISNSSHVRSMRPQEEDNPVNRSLSRTSSQVSQSRFFFSSTQILL